MMKRLAIINAVGLSESVLGRHTSALNAYRKRVDSCIIDPAFPALTCTSQSNYLTGKSPSEHGIVGNGWFDRELAEVQFWKQSNGLVSGKKIWEMARKRRPNFKCAKLFWWFNMYSSADFSITPRPIYPADGRKIFDIYTHPYDLREEIKRELGEFPFPTFWGPAAGRSSPLGRAEAASCWIAESAKWVEERHLPDLSLIYLPHLDYNLQRFGPNHSEIGRDYQRLDKIVGGLISFFERRDVAVCVLSEYGISEVHNPIFLNRIFRKKGWLIIKDELGLEILDCGQSEVFAVADHQIAHVYVRDLSLLGKVRSLLESTEGVSDILTKEGKQRMGIDHKRAGDLIAISDEDAWFSYYYWLDDARAPDFARCVDIHRKPGYDPVELFLDPEIAFPKLKIAWRLLKSKMGFRMLMNLISLDAKMPRGSHGRLPLKTDEFPILIAPKIGKTRMKSYEVFDYLHRTLEI